MGEIHELFVLALSLVWFAGATPEIRELVHKNGVFSEFEVFSWRKPGEFTKMNDSHEAGGCWFLPEQHSELRKHPIFVNWVANRPFFVRFARATPDNRMSICHQSSIASFKRPEQH